MASFYMSSNERLINDEIKLYTIYNSNIFPFLLKTTNIPELIERLKIEKCDIVSKGCPKTTAIFQIDNDITSNITKCFQEQAILNTKITIRGNIILKSFWEALKMNPQLLHTIVNSEDPHEEIWKQSKKYKYKIPTTFMPSYAKAIYDFSITELQKLDEATVLDPCAGWGDRFLAALASDNVCKYIGFDPNPYLRPGYIQIAKSFGINVKYMCDQYIVFSNDSIIYTLPFEVGSKTIPSNSVDFVFTSPPFFDYEIYSDMNPVYKNWIRDFYQPMFYEAIRICRNNHYLAIYIDDTSSGNIKTWIETQIESIFPGKIKPSLWFIGVMSKKQRNIYLLQKNSINISNSKQIKMNKTL